MSYITVFHNLQQKQKSPSGYVDEVFMSPQRTLFRVDKYPKRLLVLLFSARGSFFVIITGI